MKVGFYLDNKKIEHVNFSHVLEGNPGVGGTEYLTVLMSLLLSKRNNMIDITLFITSEASFPKELNTNLVLSVNNAWEYCNYKKYDYLIYRPLGDYNKEKEILTGKSYTKAILWCHNYVTYHMLDLYAKSNNIARIINVGREQMELYMDTRCYKKSDYIYNGFDIKEPGLNIPLEKRKNIVTFIGGLGPSKGFHLLAKAWPTVVRSIPDAQLYVIGGGKLYDKDMRLGEYGLAEYDYEKSFINYIVRDGKIMDNIHFMGIMGPEKNKILAKTRVGVPNPSGISETFGITALEFQSMGAYVVTKRCPGYIDTVFNGKLYKNDNKLAEYIIDALRVNDIDGKYFLTECKRLFDFNHIASEWESLLLDMPKLNEHLNHTEERSPNNFGLKHIKRTLSAIKTIFPVLYDFLPPFNRFSSKLLNYKL